MTEHPSFKHMPAGEPIVGKTYRADGWQYIDLPSLLAPNMKKLFLSKIGVQGLDYVILAESLKDGYWWRGQLLISPKGQENMRNAVKDKFN